MPQQRNEKKGKVRKPAIDTTLGRVPPQAPDLEKIILGTLVDKPELLLKYPFLTEEVFYKHEHQIIYKHIRKLVLEDKKPDVLLLKDSLENSGEIEEIGGSLYLVTLFKMVAVYIDTHVKVITDKYFLRKIIELCQEAIPDAYDATNDPVDIAERIETELNDLFEFDSDVTNSFVNSVKMTLQNMRLSQKGTVSRVFNTGYEKLDKNLSIRTGYICIIAGAEASGKSKFVLSIVNNILENEQNTAIQWFSMEDDREEIIRGFLAKKMKLTTKELQSINYDMSEQEFETAEELTSEMSHYNVDFYDKIIDIDSMVNRCRRFANKYPNEKKLIVIDNLGLIECNKFGVERDDFLAAKIKWIADFTGAGIILVHHFTKEIARKANLEDGYRPRKEYLKGSTRILDYVQQALFVNLPRKYPDLLSEEKQIPLNFMTAKNIEFDDNNFEKYLWNINPQRDKETQAITDLKGETKIKLRTLVNSNVKVEGDKPISFSYIIRKYTEYSNSIDIKNSGREERYKVQKLSIYTFIVRKMYNESYISTGESGRSKYLYGKNEKLRGMIDDLFIAESIKNRDDENIEEGAIFRFVADLGYNIFKEITE